LIISALKTVIKQYDIKPEELGKKDDSHHDRIVFSLSSYLKNLQECGAKFSSTENTIEKILTGSAVYAINDSDLSKILGVSRRRIKNAKIKRSVFDDIVKKEERSKEGFYSDSSDPSDADISDADSEILNQYVEENESDYYSEKEIDEETEIGNNTNNQEKKKVRIENIFEMALIQTQRKEKIDKVDLQIVRDFGHEQCRQDTFSNTRILVREYDDSHSYHDMHIRLKSLEDYYIIFEDSYGYHRWRNENKRKKRKKNSEDDDEYTYPTIKFRSFTNAFCPCCLDQKQRDCANYVQVNLTNALKALGNLRKHHNIANAMKSCSCNGHKNEHYLQCHTSLRKFTNAILCPAVEYESISGDYSSLPSIEEQEMVNITASNEKIKQKLNESGSSNDNRNKKREGSVRQKESIKLLSWGPLFSCHKKICAYEKCEECGLGAFFSSENLCDAERDEDIEVTVRKYEKVMGRSRGAQMEIVEVKMNGSELMDHLIQCASLAIPHEWNVIWNSHARQICVNTSLRDTVIGPEL
jgi:hypothetical protein